MTDTEAKALALVNVHSINRRSDLDDAKHTELRCALLDAVQSQEATEARHATELRELKERFESFRQEVSDEVARYVKWRGRNHYKNLDRFIIPASDLLVEALSGIVPHIRCKPDETAAEAVARQLRAAIPSIKIGEAGE